MKVYGEIGPLKILKFQSVWLHKYSPIYNVRVEEEWKMQFNYYREL